MVVQVVVMDVKDCIADVVGRGVLVTSPWSVPPAEVVVKLVLDTAVASVLVEVAVSMVVIVVVLVDFIAIIVVLRGCGTVAAVSSVAEMVVVVKAAAVTLALPLGGVAVDSEACSVVLVAFSSDLRRLSAVVVVSVAVVMV